MVCRCEMARSLPWTQPWSAQLQAMVAPHVVPTSKLESHLGGQFGASVAPPTLSCLVLVGAAWLYSPLKLVAGGTLRQLPLSVG